MIKIIGYRLILLMTLGLLAACQSTPEKQAFDRDTVQETLSSYLKTYAFREDFDYFLSFYAGNAVLEDVIRGEEFVGIDAIKSHLNWHDPEFSLGMSASHLISEQIIIDGNQAVIQGYFMPFIYQGVKLGPWRFTTHLEFNEDMKITRQTDWVNYTPKVIFNNSPNANLKINIPDYYFNRKTEH